MYSYSNSTLNELSIMGDIYIVIADLLQRYHNKYNISDEKAEENTIFGQRDDNKITATDLGTKAAT